MGELGRPLGILARPASQLAAARCPFGKRRLDIHRTNPRVTHPVNFNVQAWGKVPSRRDSLCASGPSLYFGEALCALPVALRVQSNSVSVFRATAEEEISCQPGISFSWVLRLHS
jgi:hypothetical protein